MLKAYIKTPLQWEKNLNNFIYKWNKYLSRNIFYHPISFSLPQKYKIKTEPISHFFYSIPLSLSQQRKPDPPSSKFKA